MAAFAGYGFPKAHAAGYAAVAYRTAYLKTHYPADDMLTAVAKSKYLVGRGWAREKS